MNARLLKKITQASVRSAALNEDKKISSIVGPALNDFPKNLVSPSSESLIKMAQRVRNKKGGLPKPPESLSDLQIPEELQHYVNGKFYRGSVDNNHFFASDNGIELLKTQKTWLGDGTFKIVPKMFYQLYILHVQWEKTHLSVPVMYILMKGKSISDYTSAFNYIKILAPKAEPQQYTSDFESACIAAFEACFSDAETKTCFFHLSQSFKRHAEENGLKVDMESDQVLKLDFLRLRAIAFVPCHDVETVWDYLIEKVDPRLKPIIDWYTHYYIGRRKKNGRGSPQFAISSWNVHERTVEEAQRTTNCLEGSNNALRKHFENDHPNLWTFIQQLGSYQMKIDNKKKQYQERGVKRTRIESIELQKGLCNRYGTFVNPMDFIDEIIKTFMVN